MDAELKEKLDAYLAQGGKLILSGESGQWRDRNEFAFDLGAEYGGLSPFHPPATEPIRGHDYILPEPEFRADFVKSPQVMYARSHRIRVTSGSSLGQVFDPYFNRTWEHFCSHQHTPNRLEPSGFDCGVRNGNILYFSHPVFRHYRSYGAVAYREFVVKAIRAHLGDSRTLETNLPSTARVSLTHQPAENRHILHLLYAPTVSRGGVIPLSGGTVSAGNCVEVIEELPPLHDVEIVLGWKANTARLVPAGTDIPLTEKQGKTTLRLKKFSCHQMIEIS